MILLIGGTSETASLATGLAGAGYAVLVSTATETALTVGDHQRIRRRSGRLDEEGLVDLGRREGLRAIVDAAHPYAAAIHIAARAAAAQLGIPCLAFRRPEAAVPKRDAALPPVRFAADHLEAAQIAFDDGRPVLLTTGSRNLAPYALAARKTGIPLAARVLDAPESLAACREAGIPPEGIITGRGPFSVEENLAAIGRFRAGVLVTKESGRAGGFAEKLAAAQAMGCAVVVLRRPPLPAGAPPFESPNTLLGVLRLLVPPEAEGERERIPESPGPFPETSSQTITPG